jgi:hypothetical protein
MRASDRKRKGGSPEPRGRSQGQGDAGYATAETAVALPALVLLLAMLVWGVLAAAAQIRCVDAARIGARSAARGDPEGTVMAAVHRAAPSGAQVVVSRDSDTVRVEVNAPCNGPGGMARALSVRVSAAAVAAREDISPDGGVRWP